MVRLQTVSHKKKYKEKNNCFSYEIKYSSTSRRWNRTGDNERRSKGNEGSGR